MDFPISLVVNVSVSQSQLGAGKYNNSNVALFTRETPGSGFGNAGFKLYLDSTGPTTDFGSDSDTAALAQAVFAQQPNIRTGGGYLCVIPFLEGVDQEQTLALDGVAASGQFSIKFGSSVTAPIQWNATAAQIQAALRALPGLSQVVVTGSIAAQSIVVQLTGVGGSPAPMTITASTLMTAAPAAVGGVFTVTEVGTNETIEQAILRTQGLVQYFGVMAAEITPVDLMAQAALYVSSQRLIAFWVSRTAADVAVGGALDLFRQSNQPQNRGLYYGSPDDLTAMLFMASYASSGLSVDFTGSNTTKTMHLKGLSGPVADPSMDVTTLANCQAAGVDVYISIQTVAKCFTSGKNLFFDRIYNRLAYAGDLAVAGFNYLAETDTKVPQTEDAMKAYKGAYRQVCNQYVKNQFLAPGAWTGETPFGNPADFIRNVKESGFYIYSDPIADQDPADREARILPLVQIASKEAGAGHSGNVLINLNP